MGDGVVDAAAVPGTLARSQAPLTRLCSKIQSRSQIRGPSTSARPVPASAASKGRATRTFYHWPRLRRDRRSAQGDYQRRDRQIRCPSELFPGGWRVLDLRSISIGAPWGQPAGRIRSGCIVRQSDAGLGPGSRRYQARPQRFCAPRGEKVEIQHFRIDSGGCTQPSDKDRTSARAPTQGAHARYEARAARRNNRGAGPRRPP